MELRYLDEDIVVCIKEPGVLSTDEPGGLPELVRKELGNASADVRTVHRLDRVVGGLVVLARNHASASLLSRQVREGTLGKYYLAAVHGIPAAKEGIFRDILDRDPRERKTFVADALSKTARQAELRYRSVAENGELSLVKIELITGRTHQIRAQFSSRGMPLWGDRKYGPGGLPDDSGSIGLWSCALRFCHPRTGEELYFKAVPPDEKPWSLFNCASPAFPVDKN